MKNKYDRILDGVFLLLFLGLSVYFIVEAYVGQLIPHKYILIAVSVLLLLLILILLTFKSKKLGWNIARKVVLVLLSVVLMTGAVFQGQIRSAFDKIKSSNIQKDVMYVISLKNGDIDSLDKVSSLAYSEQLSELTLYSLEQLSDENFEHIGMNTMSEVLTSLDESKADAALISSKDQTTYQKLENSDYNSKYQVIHTIEMEITTNTSVSDVDITKKPFVVYISGMDDMGEPNYNGLSDVNMLLMVDPIRHHVDMISMNRDTYVPNSKLGDCPDKLTHLGWDGPEAGAEVFERIFDINVDYTAKVTFESLIKIVDTLGGIDVDVKISFTEQDENRSFDEGDLIHLDAGYQHLNGKQALAYARHRKTEGWDVLGREQAQRDIVAAIVNKILSVDGALKIGDVLNVGASYVATNMPMEKAKAFVMNAIDEKSNWTFSSSTVNSPYEYLFPCASFTGMDLYAVLLMEDDIMKVHDLYVNMNREVKLSEFEFDLTNMEEYRETFTLDPHVITVENYYTTVPTYFPDYLRENF